MELPALLSSQNLGDAWVFVTLPSGQDFLAAIVWLATPAILGKLEVRDVGAGDKGHSYSGPD